MNGHRTEGRKEERKNGRTEEQKKSHVEVAAPPKNYPKIKSKSKVRIGKK